VLEVYPETEVAGLQSPPTYRIRWDDESIEQHVNRRDVRPIAG
jgi:hypothetical protein